MKIDEAHCLGILGRGLTGRSAQAYCERYHQKYLMWDQNDISENERAASLANWIAHCDMFLISPGVSPHKPLYQPLLAKKCLSDIELFCSKIPKVNFIYITGSNGKTSTVDLLCHVLTALGERAHGIGNNENPVLREIESIREGDWVVIELSSAQLWWTNHLPKARFAAITSWAPNHIDWHGTLEDYRASKLKVLQWAEKAYCPNELYSSLQGEHIQPWPTSLSEEAQELLSSMSESVRLSPSRYAAIAVLHIATALGWDLSRMSVPLKQWQLLPFRAERKECYGTTWVNDSKSTTHAATEALISTLPPNPEGKLLILGGVLKGQSPELFRALGDCVEKILLIGESSISLSKVFGEKAVIVGTLESAFQYLRKMRRRPSWVIFSPGAASLDQFAHYKERGQFFWKYVENFYDLTPVL